MQEELRIKIEKIIDEHRNYNPENKILAHNFHQNCILRSKDRAVLELLKLIEEEKEKVRKSGYILLEQPKIDKEKLIECIAQLQNDKIIEGYSTIDIAERIKESEEYLFED